MAVQSFRQIVGAGPSTASPSNSTLVIIDAQNEYAEGKLKVSNAPSSRKAIAALLKKYRERIGELVHDDLGQVVARDAGDVAVADTVLRDEDVVAQARGVAGGRRNADVCLEKEKVSSRPMRLFNGGSSRKTHHVSSQHELRTRLPAQILLQLRVRKRARVDLANHLLAILRVSMRCGE